VTLVAAAPAAARRRRRRTGRKVAVLGGGVAGLTAAHELVERGFNVVVYERKALGGKARSMPFRGTGRGGRRDLPGEHGFRFFPGFYQHIPDTMRRIPYPGNENGVFDNLVAAQQTVFSRSNGRPDLILPPFPRSNGDPYELEQTTRAALYEGTTIPPDESSFFARQFAVFLTSSEERRLGQWEHTSWWDYIRAEGKSEEYKRMLAIGVTRNLVAAKAEAASTRTIGRMAEQFLYAHPRSGSQEAPDRLLNGPTNEAWIVPWVRHLRAGGVRFRRATVESLRLRKGRIASARVRDRRGRRREVEADWFVCAMPAERARRRWSRAILRADPHLAGMRELVTDWMNGIQFYLDRQLPLVSGHLSYVDSPWALTSISQQQFWDDRDLPSGYGDGRVRDILSVDISNWQDKGILYGRPAMECSPEEIAREVYAQIQAHVNDNGREELPSSALLSWHLDPAIRYPRRLQRPGRRRATNDERLLINTVGSWYKRPDATTAIPNLFLASDYVRTNIDLATMEGANESARAAVAGLMRAAGTSASPPRMYTLYEPPEFEAAKREDAARYKRGQPHVLDGPWPGD
jgi:uncharacterized protein with NAD-binding domain and iron-sulfur cluster